MFERNFLYSVLWTASEKIGELPREVCISRSWWITRYFNWIHLYTYQLWYACGYRWDKWVCSAAHESIRATVSSIVAIEDFWYDESDRRLLSLFYPTSLSIKTSHFRLVKLRGIFRWSVSFYGNKSILDGISQVFILLGTNFDLRSLRLFSWIIFATKILSSIIISIFISLWFYDCSTPSRQTCPGRYKLSVLMADYWWEIIGPIFAARKRVSSCEMILKNSKSASVVLVSRVSLFLIRILLNGLDYSGVSMSTHFSSQWPSDVIGHIVKKMNTHSLASKNATGRQLWAKQDEHWFALLQYTWSAFLGTSTPLIALVRSVFLLLMQINNWKKLLISWYYLMPSRHRRMISLLWLGEM